VHFHASDADSLFPSSMVILSIPFACIPESFDADAPLVPKALNKGEIWLVVYDDSLGVDERRKAEKPPDVLLETSTSCKLKLIFSAYTDQAIVKVTPLTGTSYRADAEDLSGLPVVTKDCGNGVLDLAFGTVPTNSNRVCGVPQPVGIPEIRTPFS
jgi:hypothetical protein